jgi:hypothetical protein
MMAKKIIGIKKGNHTNDGGTREVKNSQIVMRKEHKPQ